MLLYPLAMVLCLWLVYWTEMRWDTDYSHWGIRPQSIKGLRGILFSPFIHGDGYHLLHNTLPILVLSTALFYFYDAISLKILFYGTLLTGLLTWAIGRESYHIGVSGVIYMLFGFLSIKGLISKHFRLLALSFFVIFIYGSMIWYVTPIDYKISWEGHLSGLITGIAFAFTFRTHIPEKPKYIWETPHFKEENDEFMKCFDENGNFISTSERVQQEIDLQDLETLTNSNFTSQKMDKDVVPYPSIRLIYHHISSKKSKIRKYKY